ncbi:DUF1428 family protein [Lamprocystis purpurea]|nr:DUF1428 family protein [Lamprocystis purpurea]
MTCLMARRHPYPMAVKKKEDETVVFSWIVWPSNRPISLRQIPRL